MVLPLLHLLPFLQPLLLKVFFVFEGGGADGEEKTVVGHL